MLPGLVTRCGACQSPPVMCVVWLRTLVNSVSGIPWPGALQTRAAHVCGRPCSGGSRLRLSCLIFAGVESDLQPRVRREWLAVGGLGEACFNCAPADTGAVGARLRQDLGSRAVVRHDEAGAAGGRRLKVGS